MILHFKTTETLTLALTSGVVPEKIATRPVAAQLDSDGSMLVQPQGRFPRAVQKELSQLGVKTRIFRPKDLLPFTCWYQLLPLVRDPQEPTIGERTTVLFELFDSDQLADVVHEILRQGNDRQSFAHFNTPDENRALLRVIGPPYYSLLRALHHDGDRHAPRAYLEARPRVWVELAHHHPLGHQIEPPPGKFLLMGPSHQWSHVKESPFRDVYEVLDFPLPNPAVDWQPREEIPRINAPLRLVSSSSQEKVGLWVLRERGMEQIEQLVRNNDDHLLGQLAFAIGQSSGQTTVVVRARPSKSAPPILVLDGIACRSYLNLPNFFVPAGRRLHPPLRRDAVAQLFAQDRKTITWLAPHDDGTFTPESLPDEAFRPMADWVEYITEHDHVSIEAWVASHQFEFESFICPSGASEPDKRPKRKQSRPSSTEKKKSGSHGSSSSSQPSRKEMLSEIELVDEDELQDLEPTERATPTALQKRLREEEQRFAKLDTPLDSPERRHLWHAMARTNRALERRYDAAVCWGNATWEPDTHSIRVLDEWCEYEPPGKTTDITDEARLIAILDSSRPEPDNATWTAHQLIRAAHRDHCPSSIVENMSLWTTALERQEKHMPVRNAWLAWLAMAKLSGDDVLALARARDRILERLFQNGLTAEYDMPGFLRSLGSGDVERVRKIREFLSTLRLTIGEWIDESPFGTYARTGAYANLIFAFGLARLGETVASHDAVADADKQFDKPDEIHQWLRGAFDFRILQALQGDSCQDRLDEMLFARMKEMDRMVQYKIDRFRQHSRILEPHERINPYRRWHGRYADDLGRKLADLFDEPDRDRLSQKIVKLLNSVEKGTDADRDRPRVLTRALELSPRLGGTLANNLLDRVVPVLDRCSTIIERTLLLEKALLIAAHYGRAEVVQLLIDQFEASLAKIVSTYMALQVAHSAENREKRDTIETLFTQSLRGLRKLGMRDEMGRIFTQVARLLEQHESGKHDERRMRAWRLLTCVIGGHYYFEQIEPAERAANEVRQILFHGELPPIERKGLACAYIEAVGHAPIDIALDRINQLFHRQGDRFNLHHINDNMTTSTHYSIMQLDVVETIVLTLGGEEFKLNSEGSRWLDEDEFLVRRRIHRDMEAAMNKTSH